MLTLTDRRTSKGVIKMDCDTAGYKKDRYDVIPNELTSHTLQEEDEAFFSCDDDDDDEHVKCRQQLPKRRCELPKTMNQKKVDQMPVVKQEFFSWSCPC